MAAYLTLAEFKDRSMFPQEAVDELETIAAGWVDTQLDDESALINARLRKRYTVPFLDTPTIVKRWLASKVSVLCFIRRGVNPLDEAFMMVKALADQADAEIKEAAEAVDGLFDLPLLDNSSAITGPVTRVSSTQSPFVSQHIRMTRGRQEDQDNSASRVG